MYSSRRKFLLNGAGTIASATILPRVSWAMATYDVVVYGGTPSGIMAAYAAAHQGRKVALILGTSPLGGMPTQGLGHTDIGVTDTFGGFTRNFFERISSFYNTKITYDFEPHVAEAVFAEMLDEAEVHVIAQGSIDKAHIDGHKISSITLTSKVTFVGKTFIDASYEGDLLAAAGVQWTLGREAKTKYDESLAGFNACPLLSPVSGYESPGVLYPGVTVLPDLKAGSEDHKVQCYGYRLCLSDDPSNRKPWLKPTKYDPDLYVPLASIYTKFNPAICQNNKYDLNSNVTPAAWKYVYGSLTERAAIAKQHKEWVAGWLYFLSSDSHVPPKFRDEVNRYGLALDEFVATENWPQQLYIREARRMIGRQVMTQKDLQIDVTKKGSIGLGSYHIDFHPTGIYAVGTNEVDHEGTARPKAAATVKPYQIPYEALQPHLNQVQNLLVSVCISCSHVAWGSIRTEVQLMVIGEAAGTAASLAVKSDGIVARVHEAELQETLKSNGAILDYK